MLAAGDSSKSATQHLDQLRQFLQEFDFLYRFHAVDLFLYPWPSSSSLPADGSPTLPVNSSPVDLLPVDGSPALPVVGKVLTSDGEAAKHFLPVDWIEWIDAQTGLLGVEHWVALVQHLTAHHCTPSKIHPGPNTTDKLQSTSGSSTSDRSSSNDRPSVDVTSFIASMPDSMQGFCHGASRLGLLRVPEMLRCSDTAIDLDIPTLQVPQKKREEIRCMAAKIHDTIHQALGRNRGNSGTEREDVLIVDVGAGQGYLASVLALKYGYAVLGLDHSNAQTCGAQRKADGWSSRNSSESGGILKFATVSIQAGKELGDVVADVVEQSSDLPHRLAHANRVYIGLHACGDLSTCMIKAFTTDPVCIALVNIGCCYNLITESGGSGCTFPISRHLVSTCPPIELGQPARMLACQATWKWGRTQPLVSVKAMFQRHYFRCLLQCFLVRHVVQPGDRHLVAVGKLPKSVMRDFITYVKAACDRLNIQFTDPDEQPDNTVVAQFEHSSLAQKSQDRRAVEQVISTKAKPAVQRDTLKSQHFITSFGHAPRLATQPTLETLTKLYAQAENDNLFHRLCAVWTFRALLSSIIESLILLDRYVYLLDHSKCQAEYDEYHVEWCALFDPCNSPRNIAMVAFKSEVQTDK